MTPTLSPRTISQVKQAANIGVIASRYLQLRPAGADTLVSLCPFHTEKTPSFKVHPKAGYYKCFSCGAAGDSIAFVSQIEHLTFPATIRLLADEYGISLTGPTDPAAARHQRAYAAMLAQECSWYWTEVRRIYESRFETVKRFAFSVAGDESEYQRWGRRALRWGRIVRSVDRTPAELMAEYRRIRNRPATVRIVSRCRESDAAWSGVWAEIMATKLTEDQVYGILRAVYRGGREGYDA